MGLVRSFQESPYIQALIASPLLTLASSLIITCVITRIVTGINSNIARLNKDGAVKTPNRIAYWFPWVGSAISIARSIEGTIVKDR